MQELRMERTNRTLYKGGGKWYTRKEIRETKYTDATTTDRNSNDGKQQVERFKAPGFYQLYLQTQVEPAKIKQNKER